MIETAILLSAGRGSRLLPLTAERPKCLIEFNGRSLIGWQIEMLARAGVRRIEVVTGFETDMVENHLAAITDPRVEIATRFNPFYQVADNLGSCWIVRDLMAEGDFLILNGDTLVSQAIVERVLQDSGWPIAVTVDVKDAYDSDDMKVERTGDRLVRIGKTLTAEQANAESIGFLAFRREGADLFREAVRKAMRTPEGVNHWYLKVIDTLADTGKVGTVSIAGEEWAEVDFLNDVENATELTGRWAQ
jgi:choline kinase